MNVYYSETSPILKQLDIKKIKNRVRRARRRLMPRCKTAEDLNELMMSNEFFIQNFKCFREKRFYRTTLKYKDFSASVFVISQFAKMQISNVWADGTFSIIPKPFKQLLIIFGEINTLVRTFLNNTNICFIIIFSDLSYCFHFNGKTCSRSIRTCL